MAHNQHTAIRDGANLGTDSHATFQFNRIDAGLLVKTAGIKYGAFNADLIGQKRHITDHKGIRCTSANGFAVVNALIHGHRHGARIAVDTHPQ